MLRVLKYKVQISKPKTLVVRILKKKKKSKITTKTKCQLFVCKFHAKKREKMTENIGHVIGEVVSSRSNNI